ncbi:MAG: SusD/RagB family nutrient-binding outer membrane lipoprotein [Legionellales bacterium]
MKLLFKQILPVVFLGLLFGSCKKKLLDINTNPNAPTTASANPGLVLAAALENTAVQYDDPNGDNNFVFASIWMGHICYSGGYAIATSSLDYALTTDFASGIFGNIYHNLEDYDFVTNAPASIGGNNFYRGIGILMKAYGFQTLVDLYNNVPYSQALKGTANSTPVYDDAKTIYADLNAKIDTAIALLSTSGAGSISGDIMFGGDPTKWLAFAKTVKLRLLLRQSQAATPAVNLSTEAGKLSGATFVTSDVGINPGYVNSSGQTNPYWGANYNTAGTFTNNLYVAGGYVISFLKAHNDTFRLTKMFTPAASTGKYAGNLFGTQGAPNSSVSFVGSGILKSSSQPAILMLAAESYFLQAEAALKGWIPGNPQALYQAGVTKSFEYLGLPDSLAVEYYSQPADNQVNWAACTSPAQQLALIIRQKWAAETAINELEPYNDYRRLGLPADVPLSLNPFSTGILPTRLLYPTREYQVNAKNVPTGITPATKVWWMQ